MGDSPTNYVVLYDYTLFSIVPQVLLLQIMYQTPARYHPQTQGKIERYHRSLKNVVTLENYYMPWELEQELEHFVEYYNNERVHESLNNVTPADVLLGRARTVLTRRERIKRETFKLRRQQNLGRKGVSTAAI